MATAQSLLTQTETAIAALLTAIADPGVQEYQNGPRRVRRAEFSTTLAELRKARIELKREVSRSGNSPLRLASFSRPTGIDR